VSSWGERQGEVRGGGSGVGVEGRMVRDGEEDGEGVWGWRWCGYGGRKSEAIGRRSGRICPEESEDETASRARLDLLNHCQRKDMMIYGLCGVADRSARDGWMGRDGSQSGYTCRARMILARALVIGRSIDQWLHHLWHSELECPGLAPTLRPPYRSCSAQCLTLSTGRNREIDAGIFP